MKKETVRSFIIIGRANAGKTLFMLNFADYLGYRDFTIKLVSDNNQILKSDSSSNFIRALTGDTPNMTKCLQMLDIEIPVLKGKKKARFIDTTGISSNIHFEQEVRNGMIQTLTLLRENYIIFHLIDAKALNEEKEIDSIDYEVYRYGKKRGNYILLANKMDLEGASCGYDIICREFPDIRIIKTSALCKTGFEEVRRHVSRLV